MERGRALFKWFKAHPRTHNLINGVVLASLLLFDGWSLLGLPRLLLAANRQSASSAMLLASLMVSGASTAGCFTRWACFRCTKALRTTRFSLASVRSRQQSADSSGETFVAFLPVSRSNTPPVTWRITRSSELNTILSS